ncbi:MAG: helix-turn-helix transcriptional regulator [Planctomycetales bacterium]
MPPSLWDLTVLCLLREREMHPYEMQRLIVQRHKNVFLQLKRGSLYHAVARGVRDKLIIAVGEEKEGRRPDRTVYRLTPEGELTLQEWLRELLTTPERTPSTFVAALSFIGLLPPEEARDSLELRVQQLECKLIAMQAVMEKMHPVIGRLPLIEAEYILSVAHAELQWVRSIIAELKEGRLQWDPENLLCSARQEQDKKKESNEEP